ncbi:hypothetical protein VaNZ11_009220 [Volvox africanus]|uniref:Uncharacterized protein n=1 Tax=Volvox africanus TaxID=51714 RepID=A0ABQ5S877_9CHLO|nr:hypothetical protein VaNZ11_009220 [Volvox africanus]
MKASGEAQDVILYRREALKSPDEVLSEARKNHSIFKANLVSGSLRPSIRHVGLSRFQFGDGEFAASVESMQRLLAEKAARPFQLPEMQEPVQLTRTLSRSLSSRRNPFRSGRAKPRPVVSLGNMNAHFGGDGPAAGSKSPDDGGESPEESAPGHDPVLANDADQQTKAGVRYLRLDSFFSSVAIETPSVTATAANAPTAMASPTASAITAGSGADTRRQWSTAHPAKSLLTPRVSQLPSASSGGGLLDGQGFWSGSVGGGAGIGNDEGDDEGDGDAGEDGIVDSLTSGFNFDGLAMSQNQQRSDVNSDENPESPYGPGSIAPGVSSFSLFMRRSNVPSINSLARGGGSSGGAYPESSTGRVDKLLQELRRFKTRGGSSGAAAAAAGLGYAIGATGTGTGSGSGSESARPSYNGSGRFDSPRDMFTQRGRSVTLMHLPSTEEVSMAANGDAGVTGSSTEAADRSHTASTQVQLAYRPQRGSASQLQLQVQVSLPSPVPSASSPSSGAPSPLIRQQSIASGASAAAAHGSPMPFSPATSSSYTTAQVESGGAISSPLWAQKTFRSPTGDGERTSAAQSGLLGVFPGGSSAAAAITGPNSPQSPLRGPLVGAAATLPSRAITAHGAPLDGWSSRPRGRSVELKRNSAVGNFLVNLLSPSTVPAAHAGPSTPA